VCGDNLPENFVKVKNPLRSFNNRKFSNFGENSSLLHDLSRQLSMLSETLMKVLKAN